MMLTDRITFIYFQSKLLALSKSQERDIIAVFAEPSFLYTFIVKWKQYKGDEDYLEKLRKNCAL